MASATGSVVSDSFRTQIRLRTDGASSVGRFRLRGDLVAVGQRPHHMVSIPETVKLDIVCPDCGKTSHQSLVRLRRYKQFRCMGCGQTVRITGDSFANLEAAVAAFEKEMVKVEFFIQRSDDGGPGRDSDAENGS